MYNEFIRVDRKHSCCFDWRSIQVPQSAFWPGGCAISGASLSHRKLETDVGHYL